ncbi:MAG: acetylglucosaminyldiphospho-UDP acetyl-beta-D-mannosaminyltransferase, partial [Candidatus Nealsonbacteria bacterium CG07_land_8_20_14_0_80_40_10]
IVGTFAGSPDPKEAQAIIDLILEKKPDILFVAYGAPKQDIWIARHKLKYQVPLSMGVGGAFDMISEIIPRAPVWLRKIGLEWLWRFYKQPSRWKRIHRAVIRFPSAVINSKNK